MKVLTFDTETTGFGPSRTVKMEEIDQWPYIVQFSAVLYDTEKNEILYVMDDIIKMKDDYVIPEDSIRVHRITNEMSKTQGIPIRESMLKFIELYEASDFYVGHNIGFDVNIVRVELERLGYPNIFNTHRSIQYCTMQLGVNIAKLPKTNKRGRQQYKYPKLIELYEKLFDELPNNLHNSLVDVFCTFRCFYKMYFKQDIFYKDKGVKEYIEQIC